MITKNFIRYLNMIGQLTYDRLIKYKATITNVLGKKILIESPDDTYSNSNATKYLIAGLHDTSLRDITLNLSNDGMATGLFLGSGGGTSPTADDYKLGNIIEYSDNGLAVVSTNLVSNYSENNLYIFTFTCKNKSSENITINESGLISRFKFADLNQKEAISFMWARNTFDPIVMKPGETRAFTMEITL